VDNISHVNTAQLGYSLPSSTGDLREPHTTVPTAPTMSLPIPNSNLNPNPKTKTNPNPILKN